MPDDMLEDVISVAKKNLDEHDFESEGVEVWVNVVESCAFLDCKIS